MEALYRNKKLKQIISGGYNFLNDQNQNKNSARGTLDKNYGAQSGKSDIILRENIPVLQIFDQESVDRALSQQTDRLLQNAKYTRNTPNNVKQKNNETQFLANLSSDRNQFHKQSQLPMKDTLKRQTKEIQNLKERTPNNQQKKVGTSKQSSNSKKQNSSLRKISLLQETSQDKPNSKYNKTRKKEQNWLFSNRQVYTSESFRMDNRKTMNLRILEKIEKKKKRPKKTEKVSKIKRAPFQSKIKKCSYPKSLQNDDSMDEISTSRVKAIDGYRFRAVGLDPDFIDSLDYNIINRDARGDVLNFMIRQQEKKANLKWDCELKRATNRGKLREGYSQRSSLNRKSNDLVFNVMVDSVRKHQLRTQQ